MPGLWRARTKLGPILVFSHSQTKTARPNSCSQTNSGARKCSDNRLTESQHSPSPLSARLSHAALQVTQHRVLNADRQKTVSQKANTDPLPLRARLLHAASEVTQQRVVATADGSCFGLGCQPIRENSLAEGQSLEALHIMPGPRLNGGFRWW